MNSAVRKVAIGAAIAMAFVVAGLGYGALYLNSASGDDAQTDLTIAPGDRLKRVLDELGARGILAHPRWLYTYARITGATDIKVGDYELTSSQSPREILATLQEGRVRLETISIPEGLNRWQVRDLLVTERWMTTADFDAWCDDSAFLTEQEVPGPTCDGYLFPETYRFARGIAPRAIFETLFAKFRETLVAVTSSGRGPLNLNDRELTTLASIVEKETGAPEERPRIACVFYNRLKANPAWRLDTDPTVIYAATLADPSFNGNLTRAHLRQLDSPYNTYRIKGLPPGPIASAGAAAFEAVVNPADCDEFFFVSMNNGKHEFCPTLDCHNRAVKKWQIDYFRSRR